MIRRLVRRLRSAHGFALPTVILIVALLTVLLTSGLSRARTERQIALATDETAGASAIAESGLETFLGTTVTRPNDGDSIRVNVTGGYANVVVHLVRHPADTTQPTIYLIRSTGIAINPDSGARAQATHTVAQFAEWETGYILRPAAFIAANGVRVDHGTYSDSISGIDYCGAAAPIPGLLTSKITGADSLVLIGAPGIVEQGPAQGPAIAAQTLINWAGTLGDDLVPDYVSFQPGSASYPIQRILGDATIGTSTTGTGLLIVSGDLQITASVFSFRGIILVGGRIQFLGQWAVLRGLVMSGLNEQLGINPFRTVMGGDDHNVFVGYDSCEIDKALEPLTGLAAVRNAWMDTWTY